MRARATASPLHCDGGEVTALWHAHAVGIVGSVVLCAVVTCAVVRGLWQLAGERVARRRWV